VQSFGRARSCARRRVGISPAFVRSLLTKFVFGKIAENDRLAAHSTIAANELQDLLVERPSSGSFCRFQDKLLVDMTLSARCGTPSLPSCHFDRSGEISFYFALWHAITVSGFISSPSIIVRDVSTSVDMTELRSTATCRILLPMEVEAFAGEIGGSLAVPRKPQLLEASGQALCSPDRTPNERREIIRVLAQLRG